MLSVSCSSTAKIQLKGLDLTFFFFSVFSCEDVLATSVTNVPSSLKKMIHTDDFCRSVGFFSSSTLLINYNPAAPAAFDIEMSVPRSCKHTYSIKMPSIYIGMWRTCASSGD